MDYFLDTDHLSLYQRSHHPICDRILKTRQQPNTKLKTTIITLEEQYAGRLAQIHKASSSETLISSYGRLKLTFELFSDLEIVDYDHKADEYFRRFRQMGIRIGTQDLRIASITLASDGILLTRNRRDFEKIPDLIIQDWSI